MKFFSDKAYSANREIPFILTKPDNPSDSLAIVLPGAGYTAQAPLLHYSRGIFFNKGFDVLDVNYRYSNEVLASLTDEEFTSDVICAINAATKKRAYTKLSIVAKSIGTIASSYLLDEPGYQKADVIWLTPLLKQNKVYSALLEKSNRGLCIIGDRDPHYDMKKLEEISKNGNVSVSVVEGVNHSLEYDDSVMDSINVLKEVIMKINEF